MLPDEVATTPPRRPYIDWARGVAVLIMIEAHAADAWTRAPDRSSHAFSYLLMIGGFAAPLFLWLAGLGLAFSAERALARTGSRRAATETIVKRGLEIFILAFLFRVQAFVISPGSPPITLFRVDILNVMGPAIVVAGVLWGVSGGRRYAAVICALAATAIAMLTPVVRVAEWIGVLPVWLQWYLRPAADYTTFTLLPWAGFVFAGTATGALLAAPRSAQAEKRWLAGMAAAAAALAVLGFYTARLPTIYRASSFWTSSPTYFAIRTGIVMLGLAGMAALTPLAMRLRAPFRLLEKLGRNSLFVYWIHVELVYGYATWVFHHRLPIWGTCLVYVLFCAAMVWAISARDRIVASWRNRRGLQNPTTRTAGIQV